MAKAGSEAEAWPSLTLITMPGKLAAAVGVPLRWPSAALNVAQAGLPSMLKVSASEFASRAAGVKS
jgi:hypothetical protein